jgi:multidrug efflux pump subunit AcrB
MIRRPIKIDRTVRLAIADQTVGCFTDENSDDYNIVVAAPRDTFATLGVFQGLFVNSASGVPVPLSEVAQLTFENSPAAINRYNKNRFAKSLRQRERVFWRMTC